MALVLLKRAGTHSVFKITIKGPGGPFYEKHSAKKLRTQSWVLFHLRKLGNRSAKIGNEAGNFIPFTSFSIFALRFPILSL
jgi:hypothetical protein